MSKQHASRSIVSVFGFLGVLLICAWSANVAHADIGGQLSIAQNGQTMIRGAKVLTIVGNTLTVSTVWGNAALIWTIHTNGSTQFVPSETSKIALNAVHPGDRVNVTGTLDESSGLSSLIVSASLLRDTTLENEDAQIGGTVSAVDTKTKSFTLSSDAGPVTVEVKSGTVMTRNGNPIGVADIVEGDDVHVFGSLNSITKTLVAGKITYVSAGLALAAGPQQVHAGFFARFVSWLRGEHAGGAMTIK